MIAATNKARFASDLQNQFHGQKGDDAEGNGSAGENNADKVPHAGPNHGYVRLQGVCVDNSGHSVGRVVEAVHELKSQSDQKRHAKQNVRADRRRMHLRKVRQEMSTGVNQADDQSDSKHEHADSAWSCADLCV
jgi:hypothetical protein